MEKLTNKKALEFVLSLEVVIENVEVHAKLSKMLEQVEKKSKSGTSTGKLSRTQLANEELKSIIVETMAIKGEPVQIKDLMSSSRLEGISSQKLSALVKQLRDAKIVERIEIKRVAKFILVSTKADSTLQLTSPNEEILEVEDVEISDVEFEEEDIIEE